ncbi:DUF2889 domain-containing protein [Desulfuromonas acetoxidans]|uniref:DUF2889 domain-containing protein n=1 Tax=Desulfuromonas acetoxidans (strain DSM 684 / 11070) TaxID=281689 RepID=Q1K3A5_DESA6|nr:DUF2889 domain-containing protein [Desulfuromonas acetoxidans]EAT17069.1 hypothetical protein Dace_2935 [Desulfuromonas acetoxidans DSM 684]MBF0645120.1 DUF2889 domain-containing protein [Desulfuromonas acetoxidans]NVD24076.1 DUF2889 domain-containing protein [Desulfuromonas acetoxidans]NVE16372.1 DUF2889 domain-containing protein [Desulfuromonas acetoxidans]
MSRQTDFQRTVHYSISQQPQQGDFILKAHLEDRLHDIETVLTTTPDTLEIRTATVQFHRSPSPLCSQAEKRFSRLEGLTIGKGLSEQLRERLGGSEGCGNLRTMMLGLLPLAINARVSQDCESDEQALELMQQNLQGTCAGFPPNCK